MRYLFFIVTLIIPLSPVFAITGDDTRFDWSLGQPAITADNANVCSDTAVARFDWSLGQPAIVHDATANCTATAADSTPIGDSQIRVHGGATTIAGGTIAIH